MQFSMVFSKPSPSGMLSSTNQHPQFVPVSSKRKGVSCTAVFDGFLSTFSSRHVESCQSAPCFRYQYRESSPCCPPRARYSKFASANQRPALYLSIEVFGLSPLLGLQSTSFRNLPYAVCLVREVGVSLWYEYLVFSPGICWWCPSASAINRFL
jgi:hypothetical protein